MDYEKLHKDTINKLQQMVNSGKISAETARGICADFVPESEDERIKKTICNCVKWFGLDICFFKDVSQEECLAWLEKQGEKKANPYSGTSFEYNGHTWGMCARDNGVEILIDGHIKGRVFTNDSNAKEMFIKALERVEEQNNKGYKLTDCDKNSWWEDFKAYTSCIIEQKPAGKVEPKFHDGDWVVENEPNNYARFVQILEVINVQGKDRYRISRDLHNDEDIVDYGFIEYNYHSFNIKDAEAGDVLETEGFVFIFKEIREDKGIGYFCANEKELHEGDDDTFHIANPNSLMGSINNGFTHYTPATKEQRDTLEKAMTNAGYRWDKEKLKLEKI